MICDLPVGNASAGKWPSSSLRPIVRSRSSRCVDGGGRRPARALNAVGRSLGVPGPSVEAMLLHGAGADLVGAIVTATGLGPARARAR